MTTADLPLKGDVTRQGHELEERSFDWGAFKVVPEEVVYPRTVEDISKVVRFVAQNKQDDPSLSITCRAAGTDVTGGPLNDSIILDFMRYFSGMQLRNGYATVRPGVFFSDFDDRTRKQGLFLPSAPESKDLCALGGMIANNSGGKKTLRYGKTIDYVESLKVVLRDGNEYTFEALTMQELEAKKGQDDLEGAVYRRMHALLQERYDDIERAKPQVTKNSTGYPLWRVWDRDEGTFDLSKIFVGSQGTLGVITQATIRLIKPKDHSRIISLFIGDPEELSETVQALLPLDLETLELYDRNAILLLTRHMPKLTKSLGLQTIPVGLRFIPDLFKFVKNVPEFILTAEFAEDHEGIIEEKIGQATSILDDLGVDHHEARSEKEAEKYNIMRKSSFPVLHGLSDREPLTFVDDVVIDPAKLDDFFPRLREVLDGFDFEYAIIGHIGNGNLHIITLMDLERPDIAELNDRLAREVNTLTAEFDGSISAEHNDGMTRGPFLELMYGEDMVECFAAVKDIFDPDNIFNPRKKVRADWQWALDHIRTERPHKL